MIRRCARIKLLEGGDHALSDFDDHVDEVLAFMGLAHTGIERVATSVA